MTTAETYLSPPPAAPPAPDQDAEHLRLLAIFHWVVGGLAGLFGCIFLIHIGLGFFMTAAPGSFGSGEPPPPFVGALMMGMGGCALVGAWGLGAAIAYAGRCLMQRKRYVFCLVMAGIECLFTPFGTVLGIFTIIVLMRPSVKTLFGA